MEIWNCKQLLFQIYNVVDSDMMNITLNVDSYATWKKELVKMLKEFDKTYMKHIKSGFVEMNAIHQSALKPIIEMMSSNYNLNALEQLERNKADVPVFRKEALQERFC